MTTSKPQHAPRPAPVIGDVVSGRLDVGRRACVVGILLLDPERARDAECAFVTLRIESDGVLGPPLRLGRGRLASLISLLTRAGRAAVAAAPDQDDGRP